MRHLLILGLSLFMWLPAMVHAQTISSITSLCTVFGGHKGANYVPGVNAKGKAVTPADLNSNFSKSIFPIEIPIEVNLAERFDLDAANGFDLEPVVANLTVHEDGRIMYGEQELTDQATELCDTITVEQEMFEKTKDMQAKETEEVKDMESDETKEKDNIEEATTNE